MVGSSKKRRRTPWWIPILVGALVSAALLLVAGIEWSTNWTFPESWPVLGGRSLSATLLSAVVVPVLISLVWTGVSLAREKARRREDDDAAATRASASLRQHLDPVCRTVPTGASHGLDDPAYRVTTYWGRSALRENLNKTDLRRGPNILLLTGPVWVGKTRLLTEWANDLDDDVIVGWLRPSAVSGHHSVGKVVDEAVSLRQPVVLLLAGTTDDAVAALAALSNTEAPIALVIETRDATQLREQAGRTSPAARQLLTGAREIAVRSPGTPADYEHRYGQMVQDYRAAFRGSASRGMPPGSTRAWTTEPIGLISALAMIHASEGNAGAGLSVHDSFALYWERLTGPWIRDQRPSASYGLPQLSDQQLEDALVLTALIGDAAVALRARKKHKDVDELAPFKKLDRHEADQLAAWARRLLAKAASQSTSLASLAATTSYDDARIAALGSAIRLSVDDLTLQAIRQCLVAEEFFDARPLLLLNLTAPEADQIRLLLPLAGEAPDHARFDRFLAGLSHETALDIDQVSTLLEAPTLDRLPWTRIALLEQQLAMTPPDQAEIRSVRLDELAFSLADLGEHKLAVNPSEEAVALWRGLAADNPTAHNPNLAAALTNLGGRLADLGRHNEALTATEEAIDLLRGLAAHNPNLARALNNLGVFLSDLGRYKEALTATEEAITLSRGLATDNPRAHNPDLAGALANSAGHLSELGRHQEALTTTDEAILLYRSLAEDNSRAHVSGLAGCLINRGRNLSELGRHSEALAAARESVHLLRDLAEDNPAQHSLALIRALGVLGNGLYWLARYDEALNPREEANRLSRNLAKTNAARHNPTLAGTLNNLGIALYCVGRYPEGLVVARESVTMFSNLAEVGPKAHNADLAGALDNLGAQYKKLGNHQKALSATEESLALYRDLAKDNPEAHTPDLAIALINFGKQLSELGRNKEALSATEEAADVYRGLAADNPTAHNPNLAIALTSLSTALSKLDKHAEALSAAEEAAAVYRGLAAAEPDRFESALKKAERRVYGLQMNLRESTKDPE